MLTYVDRVGARASTVQLSRVVLSIVSLPFYGLGLLLGLLLAALVWSVQAVRLGIDDGRARVLSERLTDGAG